MPVSNSSLAGKVPGPARRMAPTCPNILGWALLCATLAIPLRMASAGTAEALERLAILTNELIIAGEEMVGQPVCGTVAVGDSASLPLSLLPGYAYTLYIKTDSYYNLFRFSVVSDSGTVEASSEGDGSTLNLFPCQACEWDFRLSLVQPDLSDSASWAAALFRAPRILHQQ